MAKYTATIAAGSAVALAAATAKTVLSIRAPAARSVRLLEWAVSFDGVTASAVPVKVELVNYTGASGTPGTNSTTVTPLQVDGLVAQTVVVVAASGWTTEPTALAALKVIYITPNGGTFVFQNMPGDGEVPAAANQGFGVRCTAPAIVNVLGYMKFEDI